MYFEQIFTEKRLHQVSLLIPQAAAAANDPGPGPLGGDTPRLERLWNYRLARGI